MKKLIAITALLLFVASGTSFAAALTTGNVTAGEGLQLFGGPDATAAASSTEAVLIGKMSKGVRAGVAFDSTNYAVNTKHDNGDKAYGTADDSTAIYNTTLGTGALTAAPSASSNSAFATWTEM